MVKKMLVLAGCVCLVTVGLCLGADPGNGSELGKEKPYENETPGGEYEQLENEGYFAMQAQLTEIINTYFTPNNDYDVIPELAEDVEQDSYMMEE